MTAVKTSLASLSLAMKAGVTYGTDEDDWTTERVDGEMAICDVALRTLRQLDEAGKLGDKGIEVEKAGQAVIARAMSLGMVSNRSTLGHTQAISLSAVPAGFRPACPGETRPVQNVSSPDG